MPALLTVRSGSQFTTPSVSVCFSLLRVSLSSGADLDGFKVLPGIRFSF